MPDIDTLAKAIAHVRDFRTSLYDGDEIDEASGLSAADLDIVIAAAERQLQSETSAGSDLTPGGSLTVDDLGDVA
ncbi:hypothetical protein GGQ80_002460 [Sphingomonas jinjuensis]|uniref:Uncharacterized protein n=1 Tax=Sphingomonas jinjuensis TaxID=535907 RepID=A0A840FFR2_9SPHN|nr:hypothetical protein [Sphingomonas jinjuensis]MBB4154544.1 hypothetical protein [Sphingomonas jinjuensis]